MRVLVTGAGGFLGSNICQHFGEAGHAIAAVGRFAGNGEIATNYPGLELLAGMTLPDPAFERAAKSFRPDVVVHCAATALVADSVKRPYADFQRSVDVCAYVLQVLHQTVPDCVFILLSSASLYGNPEVLPISESARCAPLSPYGYHKWLCELVVEEYRALFNMRVGILRIFSAYGAGLRRQVLYDLCSKMTDASPDVRLFGTGQESRDFVHARDVAQAVACVAAAAGAPLLSPPAVTPLRLPAAPAIYNVGSGIETTIAELAHMLADELGCDKEIVFSNQQLPGYPTNWRGDISRLQGIGYRPGVALRQGIGEYCRWFRSTVGVSGSSRHGLDARRITAVSRR
jgi:UDP-glucose 4-epimerase